MGKIGRTVRDDAEKSAARAMPFARKPQAETYGGRVAAVVSGPQGASSRVQGWGTEIIFLHGSFPAEGLVNLFVFSAPPRLCGKPCSFLSR
jgi:hypothetical protein